MASGNAVGTSAGLQVPEARKDGSELRKMAFAEATEAVAWPQFGAGLKICVSSVQQCLTSVKDVYIYIYVMAFDRCFLGCYSCVCVRILFHLHPDGLE